MIIQSNKKCTLVLEKVNYVHIDFFCAKLPKTEQYK